MALIDNENYDKAELKMPARNNYFYGKMMTESYFKMEQDYFNQKRWLMNRLSLGYGVLCGLEVKRTEDDKVYITPGVAIDKLGREIIVPKNSHSIPLKLTDKCGNLIEDSILEEVVTIYLAYHECKSDMLPILVGDCDTANQCAPGTITERYIIQVKAGGPPKIKQYDLDGIMDNGEINYNALVELLSTCSITQDLNNELGIALATVDTDGTIYMNVRPLAYNNALLFDLMCLLLKKLQSM